MMERKMDLLLGYKPKTTEELAEWILIASSHFVDKEGKRIYQPLKPFMALQMAQMMQKAELEVPKNTIKTKRKNKHAS